MERLTPDFIKKKKNQVEQDLEKRWKRSHCFEGSTNSCYSIPDRYLFNLLLKTSSNRDFSTHLGKKSQQVATGTTSEPFCHPTTVLLTASQSQPSQSLFTPFRTDIKKADRLGWVHSSRKGWMEDAPSQGSVSLSPTQGWGASPRAGWCAVSVPAQWGSVMLYSI